LYYEQKNFDGALAEILTVFSDAKDHKEMRILAAHCSYHKKDYSAALRYFREAWALDKKNDQINFDIYNILILQEQYREARRSLRGLIAHKKKNDETVHPEYFMLLGKTELLMGKPDSALESLRLAKKDADAKLKPELIQLEARALIALGEFDSAEIALSWAESLGDSKSSIELLRLQLREVKAARAHELNKVTQELRLGYEALANDKNPEVKKSAELALERLKIKSSNASTP